MSGADVAALYVDVERGPYVGIRGVDAWGIDRDGRAYPGPHPVVAHPPCAQWGAFRWRAHQDVDARSCGPAAVAQVRAYGGVLEHPARSGLWRACRMMSPGGMVDRWGGWTMEVDQVRWGHPCRKRSWLYIVGVGRADIPPLPPTREPTHCIGDCASGLPEIPKRQRHITPPSFAEWLVDVARRAS